jgi:short-subunit dehydrogenase
MTVSSGTGYHPIPNATTYSATKAFVNNFTRSLQLENPELDVMLLTPGFTTTGMIKGFTMLGMADTAYNCAAAALRDLGQEEATAGSLKANLVEELLLNLGRFWMPTFMFRTFNKFIFGYHASYF